ncbi:MAG TPA: 5-oxoprolinase subunit PxpA, partial [Chitinophagaceae bacterium]
MYIDLNCDMGEGMANDAAIMPFISSANIACGFHAGDEETMKTTISLALAHHVAIGAHPSFNDRENFGRKAMETDDQELYHLVAMQIEILLRHVQSAGAKLHHVKPHGALYNMAATDRQMSAVIAKAVYDIDPALLIYAPPDSALLNEASKKGLKTASEVFADRTYTDAGMLTPRSHPDALINDESLAAKQVLQMITEQRVTTTS